MSLNLSSARWSRCEWWAFIYGTVARGQQSTLTKREQTNEKKRKILWRLQCTAVSRTPASLQATIHFTNPFIINNTCIFLEEDRRGGSWNTLQFVGRFGDCHQPLCHNRVWKLCCKSWLLTLWWKMSANRLLYAKENKSFNKEEVHHCVLFCFIFVCAYVYMRVILSESCFWAWK